MIGLPKNILFYKSYWSFYHINNKSYIDKYEHIVILSQNVMWYNNYNKKEEPIQGFVSRNILRDVSRVTKCLLSNYRNSDTKNWQRRTALDIWYTRLNRH